MMKTPRLLWISRKNKINCSDDLREKVGKEFLSLVI
jgi:hypothetical protein